MIFCGMSFNLSSPIPHNIAKSSSLKTVGTIQYKHRYKNRYRNWYKPPFSVFSYVYSSAAYNMPEWPHLDQAIRNPSIDKT